MSARKKIPSSKPPAALPHKPALAFKPHAGRLAALWLLIVAAYANSFGAGLIYDNRTIILQDPRIRAATADNLHLILTQGYWSTFRAPDIYRPLTTLSYLFNWAILGSGPNAAGYHAINLMLHLANASLVYALALLVLGEGPAAWAMAVLWGVHPMLVESVTNVVGRADMLAAFGVLAGLVCYIQATRPNRAHRSRWLAALALAAAIGIGSKESGVVLPALMLLWDFTGGIDDRFLSSVMRAPGGKGATDDKKRSSVPLAYLALAPSYVAFFALRAAVRGSAAIAAVPFLDNPLIGAGFFTGRLTAIKAIGLYLWKFCWPARLSIDYSFHQIPLFGWRLDAWPDWQAILALAICLAALAVAIRYRSQPIAFFIGLFFVALAPTANVFLTIGVLMAERFLYLPAVALAGCAALAMVALCRRPKTIYAVTGAVALCLAARTSVRNRDWRDARTLYAATAAASPDSAKAHWNLALALLSAPPELDRAQEEIGRALAILKPLPDELRLVDPYYIAGMCARMEGDAATDPSHRAACYHRALDRLLEGRRIDGLLRDRQPRGPNAIFGYAPLYPELALVYLRLNQPGEAAEALAYGRIVHPFPDASRQLAALYFRMGNPDRAATALLEGWLLDPSAAALGNDLATLYRHAFPASCAIAKTGNSIDPNCPLVHGQICAAARNVAAEFRQFGATELEARTSRNAMTQYACPADLFR